MEHLENADVWLLSVNVKSSRYTKGHLGWAEPHQPEQTSAFHFDFTPTKYFITLPVPGSHLRDSPVISTRLPSHHLCLIFSQFGCC